MKLGPALLFLLFARILSAQIQDKVDFIHGQVFIEPIPKEKGINGKVRYQFNVLKDVDSIFLDAKNMEFNSVLLDSEEMKYTNNGKTISIQQKFRKEKSHVLELVYTCVPKQTVYFLGWDDENPSNNQIWTQGQGKYTSHWLPSFDDMNEKMEYDLSITFDSAYEVFANGKLIKKEANTWKFNMLKPMSSYLLAFGIGNFRKKTIRSSSNIPIELYYEPKDSLKVEPTYRYSREIFDFLENEIGVPYPWQNYKQIPVQDFLYAGMENTGATIFSNTFMVDSTAFMDKNYVNVNAHELAHQWFGNMVTEESGEHHWLHEGFATYYAYLTEKEIFGEDYFYWHLLGTAKALGNFSEEGNGEALTDSGAGSLTFYEKGAWALVMLRERVGNTNFKTGIQNYLSAFAFDNVTIPDFMWEMEKASGMKLSDFKEMWLEESEFPFKKVKDYLVDKSPSIKKYFEIQHRIKLNEEAADDIISKSWDNLQTEQLKRQLVLDYGEKLSVSTLKKALNTEHIKVRQAVALALQKIPVEIQPEFESLLSDSSYVTTESTLFRLWTDFPEKQAAYLDNTSNISGLPNKNVRLIWLTLALVTPGYNDFMKPRYFEELSGYTNSEYHFEIRLLAFQYLKGIGAFNDQALRNLVQACNHHVWHFKKSSRKMLKTFLKEDGNKERLKGIYPTLSLKQQEYIDKTFGK